MEKIGDILKTHTSIQCENKFKYLKANYLKKKESMGTTNSGGASVKGIFLMKWKTSLAKSLW